MIVKYCAQLHQVNPSILINTAKIFVPMTMYVSYKRDYARFPNSAQEIHFLLLQLLTVHLIFYMKKVNSDNSLRIQGVVIQYFYYNLVINSQISKKSIVFFIFIPTQHIERLKEDCVCCDLILSLI